MDFKITSNIYRLSQNCHANVHLILFGIRGSLGPGEVHHFTFRADQVKEGRVARAEGFLHDLKHSKRWMDVDW